MAMGVRQYFRLLKEAFREFGADNVVKLSASLAYYTVFAIGPLLLVLISLAGVFVQQETITGSLNDQITSLVGKEGAQTVMDIISRLREQNTAARFGFIGAGILAFGATTVFADIQDSINYIWSIKAKPKKGWLKFLTNRLLSFSLIVGIGFLMVVALFINTLTDLLTDRLQTFFQSDMVFLFKIVNYAILYVIITFLFATVYKVLPDARIGMRDALVGAGFTGILFLIGKFAIGFYLASSNMANTYGAAASIIIILSWVYYSAIILYFGAEFTKVYALSLGNGIKPNDTAVFIVKREVKEMPGATDCKNLPLTKAKRLGISETDEVPVVIVEQPSTGENTA